MKPSSANRTDDDLHERHTSSSVREDAFEPLLDSTEAAALLKIHPKTLQRMARKGQIPAMQIGKLWRFSAAALQLWEAQKLAGNFLQ